MLILAVLILAALLPAAFLLRTIYRMDTIEKEPARLLAKLLLCGVAAAVTAGWLERLGAAALRLALDPSGSVFTVAFAFLVVAVAEEGMKFLFLKKATWNHPAFNYRFDGVVYAVFVSLGFAAVENVLYVFHYGLSVAVPRAILAVPGHMGFAVFMGAFYGRARVARQEGNRRLERRCLRLGWLLAVLLHGIYDTCAMLNTAASMIAFLAFVVLMYILVIRKVRREAAADEPVEDTWPML